MCVRARLTFIIEPVYPIDGGTLVVPSEQEKVLRVLDLVGQEQADCLQRLLASVHIVSQEQVVGLGRKATVLKQAEEVVVLAMDISCSDSKHCLFCHCHFRTVGDLV